MLKGRISPVVFRIKRARKLPVTSLANIVNAYSRPRFLSVSSFRPVLQCLQQTVKKKMQFMLLLAYICLRFFIAGDPVRQC